MSYHFKIMLLVLAGTIVSCEKKTSITDSIAPPIADKIRYELKDQGNRVDDYFWMRLTDEQKNASTKDSITEKVISYLNAENDYLKAKMKHTEALQEKIYNEIVGRIKQTDESVPYKKNGYWYYTRYVENQEYPIYCRKKESLENAEEILLDVNAMAKGYSYYAVGGLSVSDDNKLLAYTVDTVSRRQYTLYVKDLEKGTLIEKPIFNTSNATWANDNKTFFYTKKDPETLRTRWIYRHSLGTEPEKDVIVFEEKDETFYTGIYKTNSNKFLVIESGSTLTNDFQILEANNPTGKFRSFSPRQKGIEYAIEHAGDKFYIVTNFEAKNFRLMTTSDKQTSIEHWKEQIPNRDDTRLEGVNVFKNYLVISERSKANTHLRIQHLGTNEEHYLDFGEEAYTTYSSVNFEYDTELFRYGYTSLTTPNSTFDYNMRTKEKTLLKQQEVVGGYNPSDYQTERIWAKASDGTEIPMSIVYKKGIEKNGKNPTLIYGYGSYGNSIDPMFSSPRLSLLNRGFVYAIAHIRGGEEMGRQWYEDGKMFKKKNTFTDFIACSEYLVAQGYTSSKNLYAWGGSAGGLLMGAVINMRPDLYHGVIASVPFVDVVSTMLDETIPLTTGEFDEWGNPKNSDSYEYMLSYSPYDQVKAQNYPNMLVTTGLHDSQVQYWEPAKWVAKLRDKKTDKNLLLLRTNMETGHGGTTGRFKVYRETAQDYAFLLDLAGIKE